MAAVRLLTFAVTLGLACADGPQVVVGIQSLLGSQYNSTLGAFLTQSTPYTFQTIVYGNDTAMLADAASGKLNMTFAGPVQYLCLALASTTADGIAELVSTSALDGSPVERLAGAIVARTDSLVQTVTDLRGRIVLAGPVSSLSTFAVQWQLLKQSGVDLFLDLRGLFLQPNVTALLGDLLEGYGDAAFVPASYLERFYPNSSAFRVVHPIVSPDFPYFHSTPLYPNSVLSALDTTSFQVRRATATALFGIRPTDAVATDGMYYGFTSLGAYTQVRTLMASIGLLNNQTQCRSITQLADLVQCPPGYGRGSSDCPSRGIPCPQGYQCVCSPCLRLVRRLHILGLTPAGFAVLATAVALVVAAVVFLAVRVCWLRTAPADPYDQLRLDRATVIGRSTHGPVFQTRWKGQDVAVKRLFPPPAGVRSVFDEPRGRGSSLLGICNRWTSILLECLWIPTAHTRMLGRAVRQSQLHHSNLMPILGLSSGAYRCEQLGLLPLMQTGTVADLLASQSQVMDLPAILSIATDVVNAMIFLHSLVPPVLGANLKPHHLFLDDSLRTLLGVSFRAPSTSGLWAPPECLRGQQGWSQKADVYAFSMLLYTLINRRLPFEGRNSSEQLSAIKEYESRPPLSDHAPLQHIIRRCWQERPDDRPSFAEVRLLLQTGTGAPPRLRSADPSGPPSLLKGMFPDHVRRLLEAGESVPTEHHERVTIFFSDIEDFTQISSVLEPSAVKDMLHRLYSFMDGCADDYQVHKLETVGDGAPSTPCHAQCFRVMYVAAVIPGRWVLGPDKCAGCLRRQPRTSRQIVCHHRAAPLLALQTMHYHQLAAPQRVPQQGARPLQHPCHAGLVRAAVVQNIKAEHLLIGP